MHSVTSENFNPAESSITRPSVADSFDVFRIVSWVVITNALFFAIAVSFHRSLDVFGLVNFEMGMGWFASGHWYDLPLAALLAVIGWVWRYSVPNCLYQYNKTHSNDGLSELGHGLTNGISIYMVICFLVVSMSLFS